MNSKIRKAYEFIINQCQDAYVGYSQDLRDGTPYNGLRYYDCSSLIYYALKHAGFDVGDVEIYTAIQRKWLKDLGFTEYKANSVKWQAGDILWRTGHTEMVYDDYYTMGAHTDSYAWDKQVSINSFKSSDSSWSYLYRYEHNDKKVVRRFL